ncbi:MAG TPA: M1 family metallopeptidase [Rubricoccaceae bacterium]|jgi:aminopeptidase N
MRPLALAAALLALAVTPIRAQTPLAGDAAPTRADTLRGTVTPERAWWDVTHYDLAVRVDPTAQAIRGTVGITFRTLQPAQTLQVDLQEPLVLDAATLGGAALAVRRDGNALFVTLPEAPAAGAMRTVMLAYHGTPREAVNAPWDGGFVWTADSLGRPVVATAVQGLGASAWWPVKDTQTDEPDSQRVAITVPEGLTNVSNGRLRETRRNGDGTTTFVWAVVNPINTYDVAVNAAHYAHFSDTYDGEAGRLTLDFYPLDYNADRARRQFQQVKPMLACFEHWFGPFPWYEDGYKLVETPHLGMEHQSAVAYGNGYRNGYRGRDRSGSGTGDSWDFIIVHESGHEWWGNSLTAADIADMWLHESFTNYSEYLFVECEQGPEAGSRYAVGSRRNIQNDAPIVGPFGVSREGSSDMYDKGGNMLHTIRQVVGDDVVWRATLRGLQARYRHQTVTGAEVRRAMSNLTGVDLSAIFRQYLETTQIPALDVRLDGPTLFYRWSNVVPGFAMPVDVTLADDTFSRVTPTADWQAAAASLSSLAAFRVDEDFYVTVHPVEAP